MKEKTIVTSVVALPVTAIVLATRQTDLIYIGATVLFFILCMAYAAWCERL